jgi:stearoyl-CoA desaturase (delta-9 desaturase)
MMKRLEKKMETYETDKSNRNEKKQGIRWGNTIFLLIAHITAIAALFFFSWTALITAVVLYWVSGSLGIGMGWHRLHTHRGYKVPKVVEYFLAICGTLAVEGGPIEWVTTHRIHHSHTDRDGDPHTPRDGGWWAHIGWIVRGTGQYHDQATRERYAPDMIKDPFYVWLNKYFYVSTIVLAVALLALGGWGVMLWGISLRVTLALHATWLVNSATHMWGRRRFETGEDSRNSWWVAMLTFGEGWHNNHHAHPTSARHGLKWYEFDINWWGIRVLQLLRLARRIQHVRFDSASAAWRVVSGKSKRKPSYEQA